MSSDLGEEASLLRAIARAPSVPLAGPPEKLVGQSVGRFVVSERLGRGGMGTVYAAEDPVLRRTVALKVLSTKAASQEQRRERFLREARSASAVIHPNVATIYEAGEHGGVVFIAMERAAGVNLRTVLEEEAAAGLPVGRALAIACRIAEAIGAAHAVGVVHRDLKPENVMVGPSDAVKVVDFGLAKPIAKGQKDDEVFSLENSAGGRTRSAPKGASLADFRTEGGLVLGTPGYMAPEQLEGNAVDARADVFSFGVMLYEMLTGVRPFGGKTPTETLRSIDGEPPVALGVLNAEVEPWLSAIVERCLSRKPEDRFSCGAELAASLTSREGPPRRRVRARLAVPIVAGALILAGLTVSLSTRESGANEAVLASDRRSLPAPTPAPAMASEPARAVATASETAHALAMASEPAHALATKRLPSPPSHAKAPDPPLASPVPATKLRPSAASRTSTAPGSRPSTPSTESSRGPSPISADTSPSPRRRLEVGETFE